MIDLKEDNLLEIGNLYIVIGSYDNMAIRKIKTDSPDFVFIGVIYYDDLGLSLKKEPIFSEKGFCDLIPGEPFTVIDKNNSWYRILQSVNGYTDIGWIRIYSTNESLRKNIYSINLWKMSVDNGRSKYNNN